MSTIQISRELKPSLQEFSFDRDQFEGALDVMGMPGHAIDALNVRFSHEQKPADGLIIRSITDIERYLGGTYSLLDHRIMLYPRNVGIFYDHHKEVVDTWGPPSASNIMNRILAHESMHAVDHTTMAPFALARSRSISDNDRRKQVLARGALAGSVIGSAIGEATHDAPVPGSVLGILGVGIAYVGAVVASDLLRGGAFANVTSDHRDPVEASAEDFDKSEGAAALFGNIIQLKFKPAKRRK